MLGKGAQRRIQRKQDWSISPGFVVRFSRAKEAFGTRQRLLLDR